ncbi:O-antigen ligase [Ochrobactrum sp. BH3]|nr:O-antigen ligase [Ochrobactrum sp. BH3]
MQTIRNYFIDNLDRDNRIFLFLFSFFPGVLASVTSFMLAIAFVGAVLFLYLGFFPWMLRSDQKAALFAISAYPAAMILSVLTNYHPGDDLFWIVRVLPFLAGWCVLARMRTSPDGTLLPCLILGAGVGMIATLAICIVQFFFFIDRTVGGAGNAAVLGLFTVLFSSIALMNIHSTEKIERWIAGIGFVSGVIALLLSETRSAWLVLPVNIIIVAVYLQKNKRINYKKLVLPVLAGILVASVAFYPKVNSRIQALNYDLQSLEQNSQGLTSLNIRLFIWKGAMAAIAERPVLGYGPQDRMEAVGRHLPAGIASQISVTHVHNAFLNAAVDAGLVGVVALILALSAPVLAAFKKEPGPARDASMTIALLLVASYFVTGMLGIMFGQDATDAVYILTFLAICHPTGSSLLSPVINHHSSDRSA